MQRREKLSVKRTNSCKLSAMSVYKPKSRARLKLVVDNSKLESCAATTEGWKLKRPKNEDVRPREYLRPDEVKLLVDAVKSVGR